MSDHRYETYVSDGWRVYKPFGPGQAGFKTKRVLGVWLWQAWPHENASKPDYKVTKGWAFRERYARWNAHRVAWLAWCEWINANR